MTFPSRDDVDAAISRIEESRQTHALWLDYWDELAAHRCGDPCVWGDHVASDATEASIAGDREHQEAAIAGYDHVLDILRSMTVP